MRTAIMVSCTVAFLLFVGPGYADCGDQLFELLPKDDDSGVNFGWAVAVSGTTAIVGSPSDDENANNAGAAYLFDTGTGQQLFKLLAGDGASADEFGYTVAISGPTAIVGAYLHGRNNSGSAYVFTPDDCGGCVRNPAWQCDGDVDGDGQVNPVDGALVQAAFGSLDGQDLCNYDMDCNGQINPVDAGIVQALFGACDAPRGVCP